MILCAEQPKLVFSLFFGGVFFGGLGQAQHSEAEEAFTVVVGFGSRGPMMDIITGRAPPSHEPLY